MKRWALLAGGTVLVMTSAFAIAQDSPESLLPPGFERARPAPVHSAAPPAAESSTRSSVPHTSSDGASDAGSGSDKPQHRAAAKPLPAGAHVPTLSELEAMSPEELDTALGLRPKSDMPPAARRSLEQVGVLAASEGGFGAGAIAAQNAALVRATLEGNKGALVSRWGHILLRRALVSRFDAPDGIAPADFAAMRAALLVRMGEGDAARALVQDVDPGNYTPALTQAAIDSYVFTADLTGICPVVSLQGGARKDADWRVLRAICAAFSGEGSAGLSQLDHLAREGAWPHADLLLAQKYAGAAGKARRAVKIEWDGITELNPWRYALTVAVGLSPPAALLNKAPLRYRLAEATAPMLGVDARVQGADFAAGEGVLSSAAMVDLYSQAYELDGISEDVSDRAEALRNAYAGETPADRIAAMRTLWSGATDPRQHYSRAVLTAYAAARLPVSSDFAKDAPDLIAAMLSAGLDANALRWAAQTDQGTLGWAQLALAAPDRASPVSGRALEGFYGNDASTGYRKSRFLVAGLAGLGRVDAGAARDFAGKLGIDLGRQTRWSHLIDRAAEVNNPAMVALLAGLGMQGDGWDKMTSVNLYHIVRALDHVGLSGEARMIAAEAVARG